MAFLKPRSQVRSLLGVVAASNQRVASALAVVIEPSPASTHRTQKRRHVLHETLLARLRSYVGLSNVYNRWPRSAFLWSRADVRYLFVVFAKLIGIFWSAFALAQMLAVGLMLLGERTDPDYLGYEIAYRLLSFFALFLQLCLALSLMFGTELWAVLIGVPHDPGDVHVHDPDLLAIGTKLIGVYSLVQAIPAMATESLALLHPDAVPVTGVVDIVPLIQPGMTILFGGICVFNTRSVMRLVTATIATESPGSARESDAI